MGVALVVVAAAATIAAPPTAAAAPVQPDGPAALAEQAAATWVSSRPAALFTSAGESFIQDRVVSSGSTQYVPYRRTYRGLPVVGGDFVAVTNGSGQLLFNSVAMTHPIGLLGTTPTLSQSAAEVVATKQLTSVSSIEGSQLVVDALTASPRLA
jgi:hypothetical protein